MPTSAAASAGASLMPSPTIATTAPPCRAARHDLPPCRPAAPRRRTVVDAELRAPPPRALPALSPLRSARACRAARCRRAPPRPRRGLSASPKASRRAACAAAESIDRGAARDTVRPCCSQALRPRSPRPQVRAQLPHQRGCCPSASARRRPRLRRRGPAAAGTSLRAGGARPLGARRLAARHAPADARCRFAGGRRRERRIASHALGCDRTDQSRPALGQRAGLVEGHRVDRVRQLQRLGVLDQDAVPRRDAGAGHDRRRRRQAQRAGAGDHQHRDGVDQRLVPRRRRPASQPSEASAAAMHQHDRHEHGAHAVDQALDRRLGGLRRSRPGG